MTDTAQLSADQRAIRRFLGEIRPFKREDPVKVQAALRQRAAALYRAKGLRKSSPKMLFLSAAGRPQAVVKVVYNGGARDRAGLANQTSYLTREHALEMRDNPIGEYGVEMSVAELEAKMDDWADEWRGNPRLGHTTHMVVSYPRGIDPKAAYEASLDFADQAFQSGRGGDSFDYISIQHLDTANPHTHFIINNRGLFEGGWFSVKRDGPHDVNDLRVLHVETALEHGIELTATRRLERGIIEPPIPTPEYRAAAAEARAPRVPELSPDDAHVLGKIVEENARLIRDLPLLYDFPDDGLPGLARHMADQMLKGDPDMRTDIAARLTPEDWSAIDTVEGLRSRMLHNLKIGEQKIAIAPTALVAIRREIQVENLKREVAQFFPDRPEFHPYLEPERYDGYQRDAYAYFGSVTGPNAQIVADKYDQAEKKIISKAAEDGIDPKPVIDRHFLNEAVPRETARRWHEREIAQIRAKHPWLSKTEAAHRLSWFYEFTNDVYRGASVDIDHALRLKGIVAVPRITAKKDDDDRLRDRLRDRPQHRPPRPGSGPRLKR